MNFSVSVWVTNLFKIIALRYKLIITCFSVKHIGTTWFGVSFRHFILVFVLILKLLNLFVYLFQTHFILYFFVDETTYHCQNEKNDDDGHYKGANRNAVTFFNFLSLIFCFIDSLFCSKYLNFSINLWINDHLLSTWSNFNLLFFNLRRNYLIVNSTLRFIGIPYAF